MKRYSFINYPEIYIKRVLYFTKNSPSIVSKGQIEIFRREIGFNLKIVWLHCVLMKSNVLLCPEQTEANNKI